MADNCKDLEEWLKKASESTDTTGDGGRVFAPDTRTPEQIERDRLRVENARIEREAREYGKWTDLRQPSTAPTRPVLSAEPVSRGAKVDDLEAYLQRSRAHARARGFEPGRSGR